MTLAELRLARGGRARRWLTSTAASTAIVVVLGALLGYLIATRSLAWVFLLTVLLVGALFFLTATLQAQLGLLLAFAAIEGTFRYLFGNAVWTYLVKDGLLVLVYAKWLLPKLRTGERLLPRTPLDGPLLAFVVVNLLEGLNPLLSGPLMPIGGFKQRILSMGLFWLAFEVVRGRAAVARLLRLLLAIATVVSAIALVQLGLGPSRSAAIGLPYQFEERAASRPYQLPDGTIFYRPFSVTTSVEQMADFALVGLLIGIGLSSLSVLSVRTRVATLVINGGAITVALTRAQWFAAIGAIAFMWLVGRRRTLSAVQVAVTLGAVAVGLFVAANVASGFVGARVESVRDPFSAYGEERLPFLAQVVELPRQYPFGVGLRGASGGEAWYAQWYEDAVRIEGHNYFASLTAELSLVGLVVFLWLLYRALRLCLQSHRRASDPVLSAVGVITAGYLVAITIESFGSGPFDASPANLYLWLMLGAAAGVAVDARKAIDASEQLP